MKVVSVSARQFLKAGITSFRDRIFVNRPIQSLDLAKALSQVMRILGQWEVEGH